MLHFIYLIDLLPLSDTQSKSFKSVKCIGSESLIDNCTVNIDSDSCQGNGIAGVYCNIGQVNKYYGKNENILILHDV